MNLILATFFISRSVALKRYLSRQGVIEYVPQPTNKDILKSWSKSIIDARLNPQIVFFGHSIIRNANFNQAFVDIPIINFGVGGETSVNMMQRVDAIKNIKPRKLFLMTGLNDVRCYDTKTVIKNFDKLTDSLLFIPEVYVLSILPINHIAFELFTDNNEIQELNSAFSSICANKGIIFIDVYDKYCVNGELPMEYSNDGIHIKEDAYQPLYDAIKEYVY